MFTPPPIGIGHLTMLDVAPPDWVTLAADAGFDAVGIRVAPAVPAEQPWPMEIGSPMLAETRRRLADTGVTVLDVEIVRLAPDSNPASYEALFEVGALLGASFVNVMGDDPDLVRLRDNFHLLAEQARPYGLRPVIEPMIYMRVRNLADAVFVAAGSGGGVTIDPLHLRRFGATPDDLRSVDSSLLLYYQLCDAPLAGPSGLARAEQSPGGQSVDIGDARHESRAARLLPGEGELPLEEIVAAMPADIPVSVEAPNHALREEIGALEFARRARAGVARLLSVRSEANRRR
jgi:sugar phosphate isomerase/epimerase